MKLKKSACIAISMLMGFSCFNVKGYRIDAQEKATAKEILYLDFDDATANDKSGLEHNGTVIGSITYEEGAKGKAAHIKNKNGSSSNPGENYIDLGNDSELAFGTDDYSVSFWYKSNTGDENGGTIIGSKNYNSGTNRGFAVGSFTNEIRANMANGSSRKDIKFSPIDNVWHHSVIVCDRDGKMSVYTDGVYVSNADISAFKDVIMNDGHLMIGADGFGKNALLDSMIDEVHIYKGLLSEGDVTTLYNDVKDQMEPDPEPAPAEGQEVLYAAFDGDATDTSTYENDGEIVGDVTFVDGVKGKALHIVNENGSSNEKADQYINFGQDSSLKFGIDDFSLTYWYRSDNGVSDGGALISNKNWGSGGNTGLTVGNFNNGFRVNFTAAGSSRRDLYGISPIDGVWHKVTVNFDRDGNMTSYLDGKQSVTNSIAADKGKTIDVADFVVGADGYGKYGLNDAYIDELHVVKGLISENTIKNKFLNDKITYEIDIKTKYANEAKRNNKFDKAKIADLEKAITEAKKLLNSTDYDAVIKAVSNLNDKLDALNEGIEGIIPGQMLYLSFDESNVEDVTGRDNNGNAVGNITYDDGVRGKAVHIQNENGSESKPAQSYINFGAKEDLQFGTENFALAFWYKSVDGGASEGALISNKDWGSGGNTGLTVGNFTNGLRVNFTAAGASRKDIYNIGANDNDWHYVVVNVDRDAKMKAYVDNALVNETSIADVKGKTINFGDFVIGADGIKHYGVDNVYLDEVRVFNRLMSEEEKSEFYYPFKLEMKLTEMDRVLEDAKDNPEISNDKIKELTAVVSDIRSKMETANFTEIQAMIRRLAMAYDRFTMSDETYDLTFNVLSDVHIEGTDPTAVTNSQMIDALEDIAVLNPNSSAIVIPGDITNGGSADQYKGFFDIIDEYASAEPVIALGNHDVRWLCSGDDRNEASLRVPTCKVGTSPFAERYLSRNQKYMGDTPEGQLYFDKWIDGYHFITLNTEQDLKDQAYISPEQLEWLDKTLAEDADPNKPIILQIHQTFEGTANHEENDLVGGEAEQQMKEIMAKYPQCIVFTGHVHNGVDMVSVYQGAWGHLVDVPCFWYSSYGSSQAQVGYQVNITGTNVEVKFRDFKNDKWMSDYDMSFDITDPIPADPADDSKDLPVDGMSANAGSVQSETSSEGPAKNVLDNDVETLWHTKWAGAELSERYITINLVESTMVDGLRYQPRQTGSNGIIQDYEVYVSNDSGATYELAASGKWKANAGWKVANFTPRMATNIKLVGVVTVGEKYASAAEIRITAPKEEPSDTANVKAILKGAIDKAEIAVKSDSFKTLAPNVKAMITARLAVANTVYANEKASEDECMTAWLNLANAMHYLDFKADKADLKALITLCKDFNTDGYISGVEAFETALKHAEEVLANEDVLQKTIDEAFTTLVNAKDALVKEDIEHDLEILKTVIDSITSIVLEGEDYRHDAHWDAYTEALKVANELFASKDASKEDIQKAIKALTNAYEDLRLLPDESKLAALESFIDSIDKLDASKYSVENYNYMVSVAARARIVLNDYDDNAYDALAPDMSAVWKLIETGIVEVPGDVNDKPAPETPEEPADQSTNTVKQPHGVTKPATGDATNAGAFMVVTLSAGAILVLRRRKYKA